MKKCYVCKETKELREFSSNTTRCKKCDNSKLSNKNLTKDTLVRAIFRGQKRISKKRGYGYPTYSLNELRDWFSKNERYDELFNNWVRNGRKTELKPSIDRLDDYKGYTLDNIQLLTWDENRIKSWEDRKAGINNKLSMTVSMYGEDGNIVRSFYSIKEAARQFNIVAGNIVTVAKNYKHRKIKGYYWRYGNARRISIPQTPPIKGRCVVGSKDGVETEYASVRLASMATGADIKSIRLCCNKKRLTSKGYIWKWK